MVWCKMSEYITVEIELENEKTIKEVLKELGYPFEEHKIARHLIGWRGDKRTQVANIIIRKRHVGSAANDIGFRKKINGKYELIISEFDKSQPQGGIFMKKFKQLYVQKETRKYLKRKGYRLKKQKVEQDGTIELRFA